MYRNFLHAIAFGATALILNVVPAQGAPAASANPAAEKASHDFVQNFYNWYIPQITKNVPVPSGERILKERPYYFSPELLRQLKEDLAASAKNINEVDGLDFDPYVNAQETPEKYVAARSNAQGTHYIVDVFEITAGKKSKKPVVMPEVECVNGKWIFTNFHYPKSNIKENENLLSILKVLRDNRAQDALQKAKAQKNKSNKKSK